MVWMLFMHRSNSAKLDQVLLNFFHALLIRPIFYMRISVTFWGQLLLSSPSFSEPCELCIKLNIYFI